MKDYEKIQHLEDKLNEKEKQIYLLKEALKEYTPTTYEAVEGFKETPEGETFKPCFFVNKIHFDTINLKFITTRLAHFTKEQEAINFKHHIKQGNPVAYKPHTLYAQQSSGGAYGLNSARTALGGLSGQY